MPGCPDSTLDAQDILGLLDCLHGPAVLLRDDHVIVASNQAYRARFAGGERVCGRTCHETSHQLPHPCSVEGLNCPLERAVATGESCRVVHAHETESDYRHEEVELHPMQSSSNCGLYLKLLHTMEPRVGRGARLVGRSGAFLRLLELVERVAASNTTALLLGESGTGKELLAEVIHRRSSRADGPFVPVDCSAMSETLFESELFGHRKGAFTGAQDTKTGLVEMARGGTLFLDEIGDVAPTLQVKLLRLLESGSYRAVGSTELRKADFRLVCATHRDLPNLVKEGSFRGDLYYRISAFPICIPPLKSRKSDIPLLVDEFRSQLGCEEECRPDPTASSALETYHYPGNVRELRNIVERACLLASGGPISVEHLPEECHPKRRCPVVGEPHGTILPLREVEIRYLRWAAAHHSGDRAQLAARLGISERTLYRKLGLLSSEPDD